MNETPPLRLGLVLVDGGRGAVRRLVLDTTTSGPSARTADDEAGGHETLWIDATGTASTYALTASEGRRALRGIRVARAFTAHQHYQLVTRAVERASPRTELVVAPALAALYDAVDARIRRRDPASPGRDNRRADTGGGRRRRQSGSGV
jgi:hypothetical protein